eukprot:11129910-Prorocentrum_lima.AAC.1
MAPKADASKTTNTTSLQGAASASSTSGPIGLIPPKTRPRVPTPPPASRKRRSASPYIRDP